MTSIEQRQVPLAASSLQIRPIQMCQIACQVSGHQRPQCDDTGRQWISICFDPRGNWQREKKNGHHHSGHATVWQVISFGMTQQNTQKWDLKVKNFKDSTFRKKGTKDIVLQNGRAVNLLNDAERNQISRSNAPHFLSCWDQFFKRWDLCDTVKWN